MQRTTPAILILLLLTACGGQKTTPDDHILRIAVVGDSVAHGAGDEKRLGIGGNLARMLGAEVTNLGIDGGRTMNVLRLLEAKPPAVATADAIVLSIGGNDLYGDSLARLGTMAVPAMAMRHTMARVERIVDRLEDLNPAARIYVIGLFDPYGKPFLARQVNRWDARLIATFAGNPRVDVVRIADLFTYRSRLSPLDHFHPGSEGYTLIAQRIAMTF